jgi:hypothetical protein
MEDSIDGLAAATAELLGSVGMSQRFGNGQSTVRTRHRSADGRLGKSRGGGGGVHGKSDLPFTAP